MSEIVVETTPQETIIEIDGGPTLTTVVEQEQQTLVETPAEPIIIDLNSGARGEPGSAILTGTGYPNMTDGSVGDIWLVKAGAGIGDFLIKRDTEWTIEGSLRGPAGGIDTVNGYTGPDVTLQKGDIGLASVDNTSDLNKPISTATQTALDGKSSTSHLHDDRYFTESESDVRFVRHGAGSYFAGHHPEGRVIANAFFTNDLGNLRLRGGTYTITGSKTISNTEFDKMFDGTGEFWSVGTLTNQPFTLEFTLPKTLNYGTTLGIGFASQSWHAKTVRIEAFSEGVWKDVINTTTNTSEEMWANIPGNAGVGTTKIRVTLDNGTGIRVAHIWGFNYNSDMWTQVIMPRKGGQFYGAISVPSGITGVPTPTSGDHAVNKTYADTKVDLASAQTITGAKTFSSPTVIATSNGSSILTVTQSGAGYASSNAAIQANSENPSGTNLLFQGSLSGVSTFSVRANGVVTSAGGFSGPGSSITALNGSNISSGTVADARLSTNVNLLNGAQTISGNKTHTGTLTVLTPTADMHASTKKYVDDQIYTLTNGSPALLNTLDELAAALGDDPNFATTVTNSIATKEPIINTGAAGLFYRADKTWAAPTPAQVGLGNVTNDAQVKVVGDQTIQNTKTFAGDTYITRLRSNSVIHTQTDTALGAAVGDAVITRRHSHIGSTNTYQLVDMLTRTSASTADWTTTAHYQGVAVDNSFLLSPLAASGSRLRTWIGRNPNTGTFTFGQEGETFMTLGYNALTLPPNMVITGTGSGLTSLNGSNISTGTVADARLSSNVALLGGSQTFSGTKTFSVAPVVPDNAFAFAKVNGLQAALNLRGVTMQLASTGGSATYTRVATLNGQGSTSGAAITLLISNQGDYGSMNRQTSMVQFSQRGDNAYQFNAWNFADNSTSVKWKYFVKQISTYVFELWAFRGTYDVASISVLGGWSYTLNGDSGTTTQPAGSTALGSPSTLTDAAVRVVHGSTASTARPDSAAFVEWVGSVTPTNMATNDTWINTSTSGNTADNQPSGTVAASASAKTTAPAGWYWMEGQEILISGDTALYNEITNNGTVFPYGGNTNGSGGAGSTHFRLPNGVNRTIHGTGTTARRANNPNGTGTPFGSLGATGGGVDAVITSTQLPLHNHGVSDPGHTHPLYGRTWYWGALAPAGTDVYFQNATAAGGDPAAISNLPESGPANANTQGAYTGVTIQNTGNSYPMDVLQPFITLRWMIKR